MFILKIHVHNLLQKLKKKKRISMLVFYQWLSYWTNLTLLLLTNFLAWQRTTHLLEPSPCVISFCACCGCQMLLALVRHWDWGWGTHLIFQIYLHLKHNFHISALELLYLRAGARADGVWPASGSLVVRLWFDCMGISWPLGGRCLFHDLLNTQHSTKIWSYVYHVFVTHQSITNLMLCDRQAEG